VFKRIINSQLFILVLLLSSGLCVQAQVAGKGDETPAPARPAPVVQTSGAPAPQVVTVVHRLNGLKVLSLLHRGGQSPKVVGDEFVTAREMLTNVTAGFALGDGKSIVARLPQAEAEVEFNFYWPTPSMQPAPTAPAATPATPAAPALAYGYQTPPQLQVLQRDGKTRAARYIGLDGETGLSLLQIEGLSSAPTHDVAEQQLQAGQRVRLLAPQRVNPTSGIATTAAPENLHLAVGEIEGKITGLKKSLSGKLARLIVQSPKLTSAFAGAVALNDAGETIGIVETSDAGEARLIPMALVRRAAERLLARRGSVPQPWLGVRGQSVAATPLAQFLARGWTEEEAALLRAKQYGILLTAVAPNTPAALANLRSGDVIVKLNEALVKSQEDFSFMLKEAGSGATVNFTVLRGDQWKAAQRLVQPPTPAPAALMPLELIKPVVVSVKLSESMNPVRSTWAAQNRSFFYSTDPLSAAGVESIPLTPKAAARLGASGGLLVVFVEQESAAARAGLRLFDIIESVNGQPASQSNGVTLLNSNNTQPKILTVIRDRQKFTFTFSFANEKVKKP
jgi:S1-C subfamily serine protease